jgi:alanine-glyoxylate transaminase/serine-glyoxylate transaminase/serine-pyruvate transaminase
MTSPRVMRAMASPTLSHLDPTMVAIIDEMRERLGRLFRAAEGSFAFAVSGTGTAGMETVVSNLVKDGTRVLVVVTGYFGDRLAQMCNGATVQRLNVGGTGVRWRCRRRACRKPGCRRPVHAETSTGVLNPVEPLARSLRHGARDG